MKDIDILCVGELLIDLIGLDKNSNLENTTDFKKFLGGSPANVAVNSTSLGLKPALVASCGNDGLGKFLIKELENKNVDCSLVQRSNLHPTSIIIVSNSEDTPDFSAYRNADYQISDFIDQTVIERSRIFHTTCFALSKDPAQSTILKSAAIAKSVGTALSIDLNYSEKIWKNRSQAYKVVKEYMSNEPLVKVSEDDCLRFFGKQLKDHEILEHFHNLGARVICLTKGSRGVLVSSREEGVLHKSAPKVDKVVDTTGAGDAYWTGFLYAQLNSLNLENSVQMGQQLAALKIGNLGFLPDTINLE